MLLMSGIPCTLAAMTDAGTTIADKVRGVAAEKRYTQKRIATTLGLSRTSVVERINGRIAFSGPELLTLARAMGVPPARFFPRPEDTPDSEAEDAA